MKRYEEQFVNLLKLLLKGLGIVMVISLLIFLISGGGINIHEQTQNISTVEGEALNSDDNNTEDMVKKIEAEEPKLKDEESSPNTDEKENKAADPIRSDDKEDVLKGEESKIQEEDQEKALEEEQKGDTLADADSDKGKSNSKEEITLDNVSSVLSEQIGAFNYIVGNDFKTEGEYDPYGIDEYDFARILDFNSVDELIKMADDNFTSDFINNHPDEAKVDGDSYYVNSENNPEHYLMIHHVDGIDYYILGKAVEVENIDDSSVKVKFTIKNYDAYQEWYEAEQAKSITLTFIYDDNMGKYLVSDFAMTK